MSDLEIGFVALLVVIVFAFAFWPKRKVKYGVSISNARAGGSITATNYTGTGARISGVDAVGDITAYNTYESPTDHSHSTHHHDTSSSHSHDYGSSYGGDSYGGHSGHDSGGGDFGGGHGH